MKHEGSIFWLVHMSLHTELPPQQIKGLVYLKLLHMFLKIYDVISVEDLVTCETKITYDMFLQL